MKKQRIFLWIIGILAVLSIALYGYRTFFAYKTTPTGLQYRFLKGEAVAEPFSNDHYCLINYMIVGPDGDTLVSSYGNDTLVEVPYPPVATNELTEALRLASPGSKVEILLSTDSLKLKNSSDYKVQLLPNGQMAKVIFDLEKVITNQEYYEFLANKTFKRALAENKAIDEYALKNPGLWQLDTFEMLKYRVLSDTQGLFCDMWGSPNLFGNAPIHKAADMVEFDVVVKRLNGDLIIDSRLEYKKYKADYSGQIHPIKALNILPFYVDEDMEVEFLTTSDYGFGSKGRIGVPPYTPLSVRIFNVKPIQ
jgi:hypothetical protein